MKFKDMPAAVRQNVRCAYSEIVPIGSVMPNPRNPRTHPEAQIKLLARIITNQGWRAPIVVSKRSGMVVAGHGRLAASKLAGLKFVPVDFQDFDSDEMEMAHMVADNEIQVTVARG